MITLTNIANASLISLLERKSCGPETGLRIAVKKGGCAGLQYEMDITERQPDDVSAGDEAARVFIDTEALQFLEGMTLDYSISLADSGFKIINPNAVRSCGCGTSFEAPKETTTDKLEEGDACESELAEKS